MKLHTDGTIEGTPEEVAAYKQRDILREQADAYRKQLLEDKDYQKELEQSGVRMLKANQEYQALERPPLGLIPRRIREEQRLQEIEAAMKRFEEAGKEIPEEWTEEAELLRLHGSIRPFDIETGVKATLCVPEYKGTTNREFPITGPAKVWVQRFRGENIRVQI